MHDYGPLLAGGRLSFFMPYPSLPHNAVSAGTRPRSILLIGLAIASILQGCAAPAHPIDLAPQSCNESPSATSVQPLNGYYEAEIISRYFGPIRTRITAQALIEKPGEPAHAFKANTKPGVAWNLVGGFTGAIGRIIAPFIFPQGMLLIWNSELPAKSGSGNVIPGEGRLGPSSLAKWQAKTLFRGENLPIEIRVEESRTIALMTLRRLSEAEAKEPFPKPDYQAMVREYDSIFREQFMDPILASSQDHAHFAKDLKDAAVNAGDDLEFLVGCAIAWRQHSKLPIPAIYRKPDPARCEQLFASVAEEQAPLVVTRDDATGIVTVEVIAFIDPQQVDDAFAKALAMNPSGLILDLRNCPGFECASFRAASWLIDKPCAAGTLIGASHRAEVFGENPKNRSSTERQDAATNAPQTTISSASDVAVLNEALDRDRWASISIQPVAHPYQGPIAVLTSRRTFSTAEMLVEVLKSTGRVTVIGGKTGKRTNLGRDRDLTNVPGWVCRIPCFEYIAPNGDIVSQRGVLPDKDVPREEAKKVAMQLLQEQIKVSSDLNYHRD